MGRPEQTIFQPFLFEGVAALIVACRVPIDGDPRPLNRSRVTVIAWKTRTGSFRKFLRRTYGQASRIDWWTPNTRGIIEFFCAILPSRHPERMPSCSPGLARFSTNANRPPDHGHVDVTRPRET